MPVPFDFYIVNHTNPHSYSQRFTIHLQIGDKHAFKDVLFTRMERNIQQELWRDARELFCSMGDALIREIFVNTFGRVELGREVDRTDISIVQPQLYAEVNTTSPMRIEPAVESPLYAEFPRNVSEEKAMELLKKQIGHVNYHALEHKGYFTFLGKYGLYYFHKRKTDAVELEQDITIGSLKTRTVRWQLCVNSTIENMPLGDVILSRYLECKNNEDNFIKTANFRKAITEDEYGARRYE